MIFLNLINNTYKNLHFMSNNARSVAFIGQICNFMICCSKSISGTDKQSELTTLLDGQCKTSACLHITQGTFFQQLIGSFHTC